MTLEKAKEIMVSVNAEKAIYLNILEYEVQQMKETDLHAASVRTELKKTKDEIKAIEVVLGTLVVYEITV